MGIKLGTEEIERHIRYKPCLNERTTNREGIMTALTSFQEEGPVPEEGLRRLKQLLLQVVSAGA